MSLVPPEEIRLAFQQAGLDPLLAGAYKKLAAYLDLLTRWNDKFNLTAVRSPDAMVQRHLVECAFAAEKLPTGIRTLMDYGSGAGLPGIVVVVARPEIRVTLAEAHAKKASFLREAVRSLGLNAEVYAARVDDMATGSRFDAVTMRAVEKMEEAIPVAVDHVERCLALLTTKRLAVRYRSQFPNLEFSPDLSLPNSDEAILAMAVPRGTANQ